MKLAMMLLALMLNLGIVPRDSLLVVDWNLENFFDCKDSGGADREWTPQGGRHWTKSRFNAKCEAVAKVLLRVCDRFGRLPDIVTVQEIENRQVLKSLLQSTALQKLDYAIVHYDSPDKRGIDCGLLYRKSRLKLTGSAPKHITDSTGATINTRDILSARFEFDSLTFAVLVNHHPSKLGGKDEKRRAAFSRMEFLCDSLQADGCLRVLCVGDFNDDLWHEGGKGTIKYNGEWEKIDGCFARGFRNCVETVFDDPMLSEPDRRWGGTKPRRTYVGPRYQGGVSDHYPIVLELSL